MDLSVKVCKDCTKNHIRETQQFIKENNITIKEGDFLKFRFGIEPSETMWLKVKKVTDCKSSIQGELNNKPNTLTHMKEGTLIWRCVSTARAYISADKKVTFNPLADMIIKEEKLNE